MLPQMTVFAMIAMLTGCAAYHAPGGPADLRAMGITPEAQKAGTQADIEGCLVCNSAAAVERAEV